MKTFVEMTWNDPCVLLERSLSVQCLYNDIIAVEVLVVGNSPYSPVLVSTLILEITTIE